MHRTLLPKLCVLWLVLTVAQIGGQTKQAAEADLVKCWTHPLGETPAMTLTTDGTQLFIGREGARVEALSLAGKRLWSSDLGGFIRSNILPTDAGLVLVTGSTSNEPEGSAENTLRVLSKETGITSRTVKLAAADHYDLGFSGNSLIIVFKSGVIQSLDVKEGSINWKREIAASFVGTPVFIGDKVTIASRSNQLFTVDLKHGEIESMRKVPYTITALTRLADAKTITGDDRGNITLLNGMDKPAWKFRSGGEISAVSNVADDILGVSHDNFIYRISGRNGDVVWKRRMPGRTSQVLPYAGKYVLISGVEEHGAILVDIANGKVAGQILLSNDETTVDAAAGGAIYVLTNQSLYSFALDGCSDQSPK